MITIVAKKKLKGAQGTLELNVDVTIRKGAFVTLSGVSGIGKTTLLRIIAGLTFPEYGLVNVLGKNWLDSNKNINVSPQKRSVGFVFQDLALFPNMTVLQNISFALKKGKDVNIVNTLIEIMELENLKSVKPSHLSRGQQQRVAIARAIAQRPSILLLDEPFSALDETIRKKLLVYIKVLHQQYQLTTILVTHHPDIINEVSDIQWHMKDGKIDVLTPSLVKECTYPIKNLSRDEHNVTITLDHHDALMDINIGDTIKIHRKTPD